MPDNLSRLKEVLKLVTESITRKEFTDAFQAVINYVKDIKNTNVKEFTAIHKALDVLSKRLEADNAFDLADIKQQVQNALQGQLEAINKKLADIKDGEDGEDGNDAIPPTKEELLSLIKPLIPKPIPGKDGKDGAPGAKGETGRALFGLATRQDNWHTGDSETMHKLSVQSTAPSQPSVGDLWCDTS